MDMDPNKIIDALGGTNEVARICKIRSASVSNWRKDGIPGYRLDYLELRFPEVFATLRHSAPTSEVA